jgi:thiaminase
MDSVRFWKFAENLNSSSLLVAKSSAYAEFSAAAEIILSIVKEHNMHISYCAQWGVDLAVLESTPESPACTAYGAYIMDVGMQGARSPLFYDSLSTIKSMWVKGILQAF